MEIGIAGSGRATRSVLTGLTAAVALALAFGLTRPAFTLDKLGSEPSSFSVLGGGLELFATGSVGLGLLVIGFSVVFPYFKLVGLSLVIWLRLDANGRSRVLRQLEFLGKWSLLDVFVVATLIGAAQLGVLSRVSAEPGIYWFLAAVLSSIVLTVVVSHWLGVRRRPRLEALPWRYRWLLPILSVLSLVLYLLSLTAPLMVVEKWFFWNREFSLVSAAPRLMDEGERTLAALFLVFVVLLPVSRQVALILARLVPRRSWSVALAYHLDKWSMMDVYALALLVFTVKIGEFARVTLLDGFWFLVAAVLVASVDGALYRHRVEFRGEDRD